jgi:hypothetical protein
MVKGKPEIHVRVMRDGTVTAETRNVTGTSCLEYIGLLEDLLDASTTASAYTTDYTRTDTESTMEVSDELRQS